MEKSERCPFLRGEPYGEKFEGGLPGRERKRFDFHCPLSGILFNVLSEFPQEHGCLNGKYLQCRTYTQRAFELSMTVPLTCPLKNSEEERCNATSKTCDRYWIDPFSEEMDYRLCEIFSDRFWQQRKKENHQEGVR